MSILQLFRSRPSPKDRFQTLLRPHIDVMYRMAYRWTSSQHDAEDLVQDVLIRLASQVAEMEAIEALKPWLLRVLYHRYVDLYRRQKQSPVINISATLSADSGDDADSPATDLLTGYADPRDDFAQLELRQRLEQALQTLDVDQRDVVLLHDMEGHSAQEVAEILEIALGTVKSRLHRAREKLKLNLLEQGLAGPS